MRRKLGSITNEAKGGVWISWELSNGPATWMRKRAHISFVIVHLHFRCMECWENQKLNRLFSATGRRLERSKGSLDMYFMRLRYSYPNLVNLLNMSRSRTCMIDLSFSSRPNLSNTWSLCFALQKNNIQSVLLIFDMGMFCFEAEQRQETVIFYNFLNLHF